MTPLLLLLFLAAFPAMAEGAGITLADLRPHLKSDPGSCDFLTVGLTGENQLLEELSAKSRGLIQFTSFDKVVCITLPCPTCSILTISSHFAGKIPEAMDAFRQSACLAVVWAKITAKADITEAIDSAVDIWHRNMV